MKNNRSRSILTFAVFILVGFAIPKQADSQKYKVTDLGTLGGKFYTRAYSMNNRGQVVGASKRNDSGKHQAFLWEDGVMKDLGTLGRSVSSAVAINDAGQIVGSASVRARRHGVYHVFIWENDVMTDIFDNVETASGVIHGSASDINESGHIAGSWKDPATGSAMRAFLWEDGTMTDLGTLGGNNSHATGINDYGQVVGFSSTASGESARASTRAFLWENGTMTRLGTLGDNYTVAKDINNSAQVVGYSKMGSVTHAFLWEDGVMKDLGTLGGSYSIATRINDLGEVVGYIEYDPRPDSALHHAFLWTDGTMIDLNNAIDPESEFRLAIARDINESGQIVGKGYFKGEQHAFLLTPNPLPNRGSVGTELTISGAGFGGKQGKVYIGMQRCSVKEWSNSSIRCILKRLSTSITPGAYDVTIESSETKGAHSTVMQQAFIVRAPEIHHINPEVGSAGDQITLKGYFFGSRKELVYLVDKIGKRNVCKVRRWKMNPKTGESEIVFVVPKGLRFDTYDLAVSNRIASATEEEAFTIEMDASKPRGGCLTFPR